MGSENTEQQWIWSNATGEIRSAAEPDMCLTVFSDVPSGLSSVWAAPMHDGSVGVVLYNIALTQQNVTAVFEDVGFLPGQKVSVRNLLQHSDEGVYTDTFT